MKLAGWNVLHWYAGDQPNIKLPDRMAWTWAIHLRAGDALNRDKP